ncbi:hypothetical protein [Mesorhizobium sp. M6A.T.Ce.TU.016.01.1.1]|nr:hypothetical protein [Mesorhizobium sp. M6A.T.Ce.TU.016.01.1.1]
MSATFDKPPMRIAPPQIWQQAPNVLDRSEPKTPGIDGAYCPTGNE